MVCCTGAVGSAPAPAGGGVAVAVAPVSVVAGVVAGRPEPAAAPEDAELDRAADLAARWPGSSGRSP